MTSKFYTSVVEGLKLKVRKFWVLIPTFVEVTGEKLVVVPFCPPPFPRTPILNRVNVHELYIPAFYVQILTYKRLDM